MAGAAPEEAPEPPAAAIRVQDQFSDGEGGASFGDERADGLYKLLNYLVSIPDEVLEQGEEALAQWMSEHPLRVPCASVVGCTGALLWFLGSNMVGYAKVLKIKQYVAALGGVTKAVRIMWGASFEMEKIQALGGAVVGLAAEISGVRKVRDECFN